MKNISTITGRSPSLFLRQATRHYGLAVLFFALSFATISFVHHFFSGYVLWFRGSFVPTTWILAGNLHDIGFALLFPTLLGHMYFGIHPLNRAGFKAMFGSGELDEAEIKSHHPLWYEK